MGELVMVLLVGLLAILMGVVNIVFPEKVWRWQHLFTVEGGEPTDFALFANRAGGVLLVIIGIILLGTFITGY